jgi:hypothetical protein
MDLQLSLIYTVKLQNFVEVKQKLSFDITSACIIDARLLKESNTKTLIIKTNPFL